MQCRLFFIILYFATSLLSYAQILVKGRVLSLPAKQPVSFVNIAIINSHFGTLSNEDGNFSLRVPASYSKDSVFFSALGFRNMFILVSRFAGGTGITVYLRETPIELSPLIVTGETWKKRVYRLGNKNYDGGCLYADTVTAGSAMALLIKNKSEDGKNKFNYPVYVKDAQVMIVNNTFGEFKIRVRLYDVDTLTGLPGKDLFNESLITRSGIENGWLKIDLSKRRIEINHDFFLAFEWILDESDRKHLYRQYEDFRRQFPEKVSVDYSYVDGKRIPWLNYGGNLYAGTSLGISVSRSTLDNHVCYYRLNSFGKWYRSISVLAARITVSDQPEIYSDDRRTGEVEQEYAIEELQSYFRIGIPVEDFTAADNQGTSDKEEPDFFRKRIQEPIRVEARRYENHVSFFANNLTLYPYQLIMEFSRMRNLDPIVTRQEYTLYPGLKRLLVLKVIDKTGQNYNYELSVKELIGDPGDTLTEDFPYFIPIGIKRKVAFITPGMEDQKNSMKDAFQLNPGDTVYAMRRGFVTAVPHIEKPGDRIFENGTLEIRHPDGTVMVYHSLDPGNIFVKEGEDVLPGESLGTVNSEGKVTVQLYHFSGVGRLDRLDINYFLKQDSTCRYAGIPKGFILDYPESIIMKEMTVQEKERFKKNEWLKTR